MLEGHDIWVLATLECHDNRVGVRIGGHDVRTMASLEKKRLVCDCIGIGNLPLLEDYFLLVDLLLKELKTMKCAPALCFATYIRGLFFVGGLYLFEVKTYDSNKDLMASICVSRTAHSMKELSFCT